MSTRTYAGTDVNVSDDGFFTDPEQWTEAMAPEIAAAHDMVLDGSLLAAAASVVSTAGGELT